MSDPNINPDNNEKEEQEEQEEPQEHEDKTRKNKTQILSPRKTRRCTHRLWAPSAG